VNIFKIMKKALLSLFTIGVIGLVVVAVTQSFFSDTETSTGNVLTAGAIDLKIDSECTYNGERSEQCGTWGPVDLTNEKFFNFFDLKPGDYGENTISLDLSSNPAHACVIVENMQDDDLGLTEPESEDGDVSDGPFYGELSSELRFFTWADNGPEQNSCDNVWQEGELPLFSNAEGPASDVLDGRSYYLGKLDPGKSCIGVYWCYGTMAVGPGNALSCNGAPVNNVSQTDALTADIRFYVEQYRNNPNFVCPLPEKRLVLENKIPDVWTVIEDNRSATLTWAGDGPTFDFSSTLIAQGLEANTKYSLIYYADPWEGDNPGAFLGTGISNGSGDLTIAGNVNLGFDLPHPSDANYPTGAKIWLVLASDYNSGLELTGPMTGWQPTRYLFETKLIRYDDTDAP